MKRQVIILKGIPASGKSTWAKQQQDQFPQRYKRINKDELRAMLDNDQWSSANERFILQVRDRLLLEALAADKDVIIDDTNLHPKHEQHIRQLVGDQADIIVKSFDKDLAQAIRDDQARPKPVGERVIRDMHRRFIQPQAEPDRNE